MHKLIFCVSSDGLASLPKLKSQFTDVIKSIIIPLTNLDKLNTKPQLQNQHTIQILNQPQSLQSGGQSKSIMCPISIFSQRTQPNCYYYGKYSSITTYNMFHTCCRDLAIDKKTDENTTTKISPAQDLNVVTEIKTDISMKDKLKKALKEYGSIVLIFHVTISLISLQICYLLISSGIDFVPLVEKLGFSSTTFSNKIAAGASTFVVAYAVHKVFAPIRISITLGATPLIVKYLRKKGYYLKK